MKRLLPGLIALASLAAAARAPRFLGPPVKKPADAGPAAAPGDAGAVKPDAAAQPDAGAGGEAAAKGHEPAPPPILKPGDDAPLVGGLVFNPKEVGAEAINFSDWVGESAEPQHAAKAVLVSFFATWCKPCKKELPFLQSLSADYKDRGLRVVSVAIDRDLASFPLITELIEKNHVTYPVLKDRFNLIAKQYLGDKTTLPSVFLLDKDGKVALVKQGYPDDAAGFLRAEVEKVLQ